MKPLNVYSVYPECLCRTPPLLLEFFNMSTLWKFLSSLEGKFFLLMLPILFSVEPNRHLWINHLYRYVFVLSMSLF